MLGAPNFLSRHPNLSPWSALFSLCPHRLFQTPPPPPPPSPRGGSEHTPSLPAARSREHACLRRDSFQPPALLPPTPHQTSLRPRPPFSLCLRPDLPSSQSISSHWFCNLRTFHCLQPLSSQLCASHQPLNKLKSFPSKSPPCLSFPIRLLPVTLLPFHINKKDPPCLCSA